MRFLVLMMLVYRDGIVPVSIVSGSEPAGINIKFFGGSQTVGRLSHDPEVAHSPSRPKRMACGV